MEKLLNFTLLPFYLFALFPFSLFAQTIILDKELPTYDLADKVQMLYDTTGKLQFADMTLPTTQARFRQENSVSYEVKHHWFKIEIDNRTDKTMFYFEAYNPYHTEVYLSHHGETAHYKNGGAINDKERAYLGSYSLFPVQVGKGKSTLHIVFKELSPCKRCLEKKYFRLHTPHKVYLKHIASHVLNFSILGVLLGLMLYNLFIYWLVRDKSYAYYVVSLTGLLGYFFFVDVLPFFWYKFHYIFFFEYATILGNWFVCLTGAFFLKFSQTYLNTRLAYPAWHRILHWFIYSFGAITFLMTVGGLLRNTDLDIELYAFTFSNVCIGMITLGCMLLSLQAWRSGTPTGKYYAFSNLVFFVCVLLYVSGTIFAPLHNFTAPFIKIGITVQMLCFSVALASRINLLKQEIADKKLENERLEKEQIVEIQLLTVQKNIELEQKVKERTRDLEQSNEEIRAQADKIEKQAKLIEDHKNRELLNHTLQILQKNELLPQIGKFLENNAPQLDEQARKAGKELQKEIQNSLASDTNWETLKMHFEEVHPTLFAELQKLSPDLTKNDLRYCAYMKMGLSNKDIAQMLYLDPDSVRKQQYRIKQKLNLDKDVSLADFVKGVG